MLNPVRTPTNIDFDLPSSTVQNFTYLQLLTDDRSSRIVFITRDLPPVLIETLMEVMMEP